MIMEEYQKPAVTTIEIPERTSYACNLANDSCNHISNLVNHAICTSANSLAPLGICS